MAAQLSELQDFHCNHHVLACDARNEHRVMERWAYMFLRTRTMPAMASGVRSSSVVSQMVDSVPGLGVDMGLIDMDWLMRDWSSHAGSTGDTPCFVLLRRRSLLVSSLTRFLLPAVPTACLPCTPRPQSPNSHETGAHAQHGSIGHLARRRML